VLFVVKFFSHFNCVFMLCAIGPLAHRFRWIKDV